MVSCLSLPHLPTSTANEMRFPQIQSYTTGSSQNPSLQAHPVLPSHHPVTTCISSSITISSAAVVVLKMRLYVSLGFAFLQLPYHFSNGCHAHHVLAWHFGQLLCKACILKTKLLPSRNPDWQQWIVPKGLLVPRLCQKLLDGALSAPGQGCAKDYVRVTHSGELNSSHAI